MRRIAKIVVGLLLSLVVVAVVIILSDLTFWRRFNAMRVGFDTIVDVDRYAPLEDVAGGDGAPLPIADPAERSIDPAAIETAASYLRARGPVAFLVWHRGKLQVAEYGPGFSRDTRTDPASMHKSVMAILFGAALADGKIASIDDTVATYLSEWRAPSDQRDARARIRIRDLLTMASGLERADFGAGPYAPGTQLYLGTSIARTALSMKPVAEPGVEFEYNNVDSQILGVLLERIYGIRYAQLLSEKLWQPLGNRTARVWLDRAGGMPHTFCCLQATAEDWVRVGLFLMNRGRVGERQLVPEAWIDAMRTPSKTNPNYGLQIWLGTEFNAERFYVRALPIRVKASEPFAAPDLFFFDGAGAQRVYIIPSQQLVIVRTGRRPSDWDDAFVPNTILRGIRN